MLHAAPTAKTGKVGKVIATTTAENEELLHELLGVRPTVFLPSIPHLVYQYSLYTNYDAPTFAEPNPEVPPLDD